MARKARPKGGKKAKTYKPRRRVEAAPTAETTTAAEAEAATDAAPAQESAPADAPATDATPKAVPTGRQTRKKAEHADGTMSGLDAAAKVLAEAGEPLDCKTIVERAIGQGLWKPGGKTPHATVYSAILREIQQKGEQARFRKAERGKFSIAS